MKIHEYQAREILTEFDVQLPAGIVVESADDAVQAAKNLGGKVWAVKAQVHAGGRGKGGGIKLARSLEEVKEIAGNLLGSRLITPQTGSHGALIERVMIQEGVAIQDEFYVGILIDRQSQKPVLLASSEGGMEIEKVAAQTPEKIIQIQINPQEGLKEEEAREVVALLGIPEASQNQAVHVLLRLWQVFTTKDCSLVEINPLILTTAGKVMPLDIKMTFDDNALYRHPEIEKLRDPMQEEEIELRAHQAGLQYIQLDGNIACLVNGAGLAMATMDTIKLFGGEPANFLDIGGGASTEKVTAAFEIMSSDSRVKAILVNIFGGIMKCDVIASGIVEACKEIELRVPLVVRMHGTHEKEGKRILADSKLPIHSADTLNEAADLVVRLARGDNS